MNGSNGISRIGFVAIMALWIVLTFLGALTGSTIAEARNCSITDSGPFLALGVVAGQAVFVALCFLLDWRKRPQSALSA